MCAISGFYLTSMWRCGGADCAHVSWFGSAPLCPAGPQDSGGWGGLNTLTHSSSVLGCTGSKDATDQTTGSKAAGSEPWVRFLSTFIVESRFLSLFFWTWPKCSSEVLALARGLAGSGSSDSGDTGDKGLLLSRYSSNNLEARSDTAVCGRMSTQKARILQDVYT